MNKKGSGKDIFFSHNPNPMWIYNPDNLKIMEVNEAATTLYGYSNEEMKSMNIEELRPQEEIPKLRHLLQKKREFYNDSGIWKHQKRNKEPVFVRIVSYPIEWGGRLQKLVVAQDVSDQLQAEKKLKQSRGQLKKIMDQSPAVICTVNEDGEFVQVNSAVRDIWGYRPEDLVKKKFLNFLHPDDVDSTVKRAAEVLKGADAKDFGTRYIRADGSSVWMEWSARWDAEDNLMYCIGIDATALKDAKEKIVEERNMLRAIIDNIPDYIFAKDQDRRVILSNKAMNWAIHGERSERKGLGKTAFDAFKPERAKVQEEDDKRVIDAGELIINREETVHDANGDKLWLQTTKVPLRNQNNDIYGLVGISRNITKSKKAEYEIRESLKEKEVLISEIHHRVKNNLALISGIVQLEAFDEGDKELRDKLMNFVTRIHSIANIQDYLYQSKSFSNLDFAKSLETLVTSITQTAQPDTTVTLDFKLDSVQINVNQALPASMIVNEVLVNILKSSFKGMDDGKITCELEFINGKIILKIIADGKGVPEDLSIKEGKTVGFKIIEILANQLNADYKYKSINEEWAFLLEFKKDDLKGTGNAYL